MTSLLVWAGAAVARLGPQHRGAEHWARLAASWSWKASCGWAGGGLAPAGGAACALRPLRGTSTASGASTTWGGEPPVAACSAAFLHAFAVSPRGAARSWLVKRLEPAHGCVAVSGRPLPPPTPSLSPHQNTCTSWAATMMQTTASSSRPRPPPPRARRSRRCAWPSPRGAAPPAARAAR